MRCEGHRRKKDKIQEGLLKCIPQGLKPWVLRSFCGTTEVVPFQDPIYATSSRVIRASAPQTADDLPYSTDPVENAQYGHGHKNNAENDQCPMGLLDASIDEPNGKAQIERRRNKEPNRPTEGLLSLACLRRLTYLPHARDYSANAAPSRREGSVRGVRWQRKYSRQSSYGMRRRRYSFLSHAQAESSSAKSFTS